LAVSVVAMASSMAIALAARVVVEDWSTQPLDAHGIPAGWTKYATLGGRPAYDFTIVHDEGRRALRLVSHDDHSTIAKQIEVDLEATPILEWSWKIVELPDGADIRSRATSDLTGHLFVAWPRFPEAL